MTPTDFHGSVKNKSQKVVKLLALIADKELKEIEMPFEIVSNTSDYNADDVLAVLNQFTSSNRHRIRKIKLTKARYLIPAHVGGSDSMTGLFRDQNGKPLLPAGWPKGYDDFNLVWSDSVANLRLCSPSLYMTSLERLAAVGSKVAPHSLIEAIFILMRKRFDYPDIDQFKQMQIRLIEKGDAQKRRRLEERISLAEEKRSECNSRINGYRNHIDDLYGMIGAERNNIVDLDAEIAALKAKLKKI